MIVLIVESVFISMAICGIIGAAGEVIWCQMTHTVVTFIIIIYAPIPLIVTIGMCSDWGHKPSPPSLSPQPYPGAKFGKKCGELLTRCLFQ